MFKEEHLLLLGGTGSFGQEFLQYIFKNNIVFKEITLYSRDELKHYNLQQQYPAEKYPHLRFMIGDIRDKERLNEALENKSIVINAAAMKHVHLCEQNPSECNKTNIQGTENLLELLSSHTSISKVLFISSDKAVHPINVYGRSKKIAEDLYIRANSMLDAKLSVIRYGNVYGASGSLVPTLEAQKSSGKITITDPEMKRYFIQPEEAIQSVLFLLETQHGGEILVPESEEISILELAKNIAPDAQIEIVGKREGEKLNEELLTNEELQKAEKVGKYYIIKS